MSSLRPQPMRALFVGDQIWRGECKYNSLHGDPGPTVLSSADTSCDIRTGSPNPSKPVPNCQKNDASDQAADSKLAILIRTN
jgi:hypothetical protein